MGIPIQYVPIVGCVYKAVQVTREQYACLASDPFGPICTHEWQVFGEFNISMIVTVGFLASIIMFVKLSPIIAAIATAIANFMANCDKEEVAARQRADEEDRLARIRTSR